jgi:hypothetical protein
MLDSSFSSRIPDFSRIVAGIFQGAGHLPMIR